MADNEKSSVTLSCDDVKKALRCCAEHEECYLCPCGDICGDLGTLTAATLGVIKQLEAEVDKYYNAAKIQQDVSPVANVVPRSLFEQIQYERDLALLTLEEHGIGLGQKTKHSDAIYTDFMKGCEK